MYKPKDQQAKPLPEAFAHKGPFRVVNDNSGMSDYFNGFFQAPLTDDKEAIAIRAHEYMHLQWDREHQALRKAITIFPPDVVQAGLDFIVNDHLNDYSVDISALPWKTTKEDLPRRETILRAIRERTLFKNFFTKRCNKKDKEKLFNICNYLGTNNENNIFQGFSMLADLVADEFDELKNNKDLRKALGGGDGIPGLELTESDKDGILEFGRMKTTWGTMHIKQLVPPVQVANVKSYERALVNGFIGGFSQPHRALLPAMDGQAWRRRKRLKGGTLLIDASGSMSFSEKDIEEILEKNPALTCAMYSGRGEEGQLDILAQKGKKVTKLPKRYGGGNIVDGPALEWLTQQKGPRVWLSDGQVTGCNDHQTPELKSESEALCRIGNITRVRDICEAQKVLTK